MGISSRPKLRISIGSLRDLSLQQLAKLKLELAKTLDARWRRDNQTATRSRGRPSKKDYIAAACVRVQKTLRRKKASLSDWYEGVSKDLQSHDIELSVPTIKKFTKEWMSTHVRLDALPVGISPYLISTQKDFDKVQWILIWGALCEEFPDVQRWLKDLQRQSVPLLDKLPHTSLPKALQDKINGRSPFPLGPRLYDYLIRESLRKASEK